jgi:hypothetical protein
MHPTGVVTWIARSIQWVSAIIVLGITAWAARDTKTVTVIYSLVISVVTVVSLPFALATSCISRRHRWHILPLIAIDGVLSYLWITSAIFLSLDFNRISCRTIRWNGETVCSRKYTAEAFSFIAFFTTLIALSAEIAFIYYARPGAVREKEHIQPEERIAQNLGAAGVL